MQTFVITSESEWERWRKPWNLLTESNPMMSMEWLQAWWQHFGSGHQLHILMVTRDDELVGAVPSYRHRTRIETQLRFLGSGAVSSDYLTAIVDKSAASDVYAVIDSYFRGLVGLPSQREFESMQWEGIAEGDGWLPHLKAFAETCGYSFRVQAMVSAWELSLPKTWDQFLAAQRGRSIHRKAKKCVARLEGSKVSVRYLTSEEGLSEGLEQLIRLHQARRNSVGEDGCFADPKFELFLRQAITEMVAQGTACLTVCETGGTVIAVHLLLLGSECAFMYQSGVDPAFLSLEPGHLAIIASLQYAMANGYQRFDFLRGDEPYKAFWGAQAIPLKRLILAPPTLKAQTLEAIYRNLSWLRSSLTTDHRQQISG
jgi:CelD/BcsL family acetyltransferase involved in cellulose biosynthesis